MSNPYAGIAKYIVEDIKELRVDAERYRWLRQQAVVRPVDGEWIVQIDTGLMPATPSSVSHKTDGEQLDDAIDLCIRSGA